MDCANHQTNFQILETNQTNQNDWDSEELLQLLQSDYEACNLKTSKRKDMRQKLAVRSHIFIPKMNKRKDIDENEIKIWIKEISTRFNAVKMLKCELLSDHERLQIKNAFQDYVCLEIKLFVKEILYPYPKFNENGKIILKKEKMKDKNKTISDFVYNNYDVLKEYFNSTRFKLYHEIINYYSNKLISFDTLQPTKTVIDLLRQQFDIDYCQKELYSQKDLYYFEI